MPVLQTLDPDVCGTSLGLSWI